jgi:hypothetical protein
MSAPLRVLFCIGINQNFFDLPTGQGGAVWKATVQLLDEIEAMAGVRVLGTIDDDAHMVGPSGGWPWTAYVLADVDNQETVKAVCNLFRTIPVGEHSLWRYAKVEARIGRPLVVRDDVALEATS